MFSNIFGKCYSAGLKFYIIINGFNSRLIQCGMKGLTLSVSCYTLCFRDCVPNLHNLGLSWLYPLRELNELNLNFIEIFMQSDAPHFNSFMWSNSDFIFYWNSYSFILFAKMVCTNNLLGSVMSSKYTKHDYILMLLLNIKIRITQHRTLCSLGLLIHLTYIGTIMKDIIT